MNAIAQRYGAYGLTIRSNRPLPHMPPPREGSPEVAIEFDEAGEPPWSDDAPAYARPGFETLWHLDESRWLLRYGHCHRGGVTWSALIERERISIHWTDGVPIQGATPVIQGPVLGALLLVRNVTALHGCAVDVGGRAVVMLGAPGAGKSTAAAALLRRGCRVLTDDIAAIELDGAPRVHSGYSHVRLFPDSASSLGWPLGELPRVFTMDESGDKRVVDLGATFGATTLPLAAIYLLEPRKPGAGAPSIAPLETRAALPLLMQNIYAERFLDAPRRALLFRAAARLIDTVAVRRVQAFDRLDNLPRLADAIVDDALRGAA